MTEQEQSTTTKQYPKPGQRVRITGIQMTGNPLVPDPAPMEVGTTGTVRSLSVAFGQIDVDWDPEPTSGAVRTMFLLVQDPFEILEDQ